MTEPAPAPTTRSIPIELIDEPDLPMRETMSDEGLDSLAESLRELGQLQDVVVVQDGDRFRVAAGHRRRIAAPRAGFTHLRCLVYPQGTLLEEAIKVAENDERENVNPAARAKYYRWLLDNVCNGDVDRLCRMVNRKTPHVLDMLELTAKDPDVLQALREERISLAVAQELNKVKSELYRRLYLADAINQGWTAKQARHMRQELDRTQRIQEARDEHGQQPTAPSTVAPLESMDACAICFSAADAHEMVYLRVHRSCRDVQKRNVLGGDGGGR